MPAATADPILSSKPTPSSTPTEPREGTALYFSGVRPKTKMFVGAAFFGAWKKPPSMYKKSAPKSSAKPAKAQRKRKASPLLAPSTEKEKTPQTQTLPVSLEKQQNETQLVRKSTIIISIFRPEQLYTRPTRILQSFCDCCNPKCLVFWRLFSKIAMQLAMFSVFYCGKL